MIHQCPAAPRNRRATSQRQVDYMFKVEEAPDQNHFPAYQQIRGASAADSDRDYYMSAAEARIYGLVDEVIKSRKETKLLDGAGGDGAERNVAVAEAALPVNSGNRSCLKTSAFMARASNLTMCSFCGRATPRCAS